MPDRYALIKAHYRLTEEFRQAYKYAEVKKVLDELSEDQTKNTNYEAK